MTEKIKPWSDGQVADLLSALREKNLTVGTAESCTAGMISARIADIPGSSDVLAGGIVSYSNDVKMKLLGVSEKTLRDHGAVSEKCAREMADGARRALGCDIAVSVTGIAGPGGGTPEKPVGTVCFGVCSSDGTLTKTEWFGETAGRTRIRTLTVAAALRMIEDVIKSRG
ncbi:MAG: CinA family protein [Clostridia bacterium]|nr:CinA family protein [Clostridia bacterium]MBR3991292.1 CinA family protein [Clostridia bacterium]